MHALGFISGLTTSTLHNLTHLPLHIFPVFSPTSSSVTIAYSIMASTTETLVLAPSGQDNDVVISAPATTPRNVRTEIAYYGEPGSPAPVYITDEKTRLKNVNKFHPATVYDVRGSGVEHTLDVSGIQFVKHESKLSVHEFDDNERIKVAYYAEVEEVLKNV